jgi:nucleoside 2-deoxyribosyltransferase
MRFFLAGIMQGSHLGATLHHQGYRQHIKELLAAHFPGAVVYDPLEDHTDSLSYDDQRGRDVFFHHCALCRQTDVVLAFLPEASMGTAIEMWEAYRHGRAVVCVSPMSHNWAVKFLSHAVYADFDELARALASGELARRIGEVLAR